MTASPAKILVSIALILLGVSLAVLNNAVWGFFYSQKIKEMERESSLYVSTSTDAQILLSILPQIKTGITREKLLEMIQEIVQHEPYSLTTFRERGAQNFGFGFLEFEFDKDGYLSRVYTSCDERHWGLCS